MAAAMNKELRDAVNELYPKMTGSQVAAELNARGILTAKGLKFTQARVSAAACEIGLRKKKAPTQKKAVFSAKAQNPTNAWKWKGPFDAIQTQLIGIVATSDVKNKAQLMSRLTGVY